MVALLQVADPEDACKPLKNNLRWLDHSANSTAGLRLAHANNASQPQDGRRWVALIVRSQGQQPNCTFDAKVPPLAPFSPYPRHLHQHPSLSRTSSSGSRVIIKKRLLWYHRV